MKNLITGTLLFACSIFQAQIKTPAPSPGATIEQKIGLTDVSITYSRPHKRDREIFGSLVPFDKMWRTGANKNTIITTSDILIFGNDTLKAGSYSIFTIPNKDAWTILFYGDTENWGIPENWEDKEVMVKTTAKAGSLSQVKQSFTIGFNDVQMDGAELTMSWDKTVVTVPFKTATKERVTASIKKVMNGPAAEDYYKAADYYLSQKTNIKTALNYINKALDLKKEKPFWYLRRKALIQAELKDYKGAIETAKLSMAAAKKANYESYVKSNQLSIDEWSKK